MVLATLFAAAAALVSSDAAHATLLRLFDWSKHAIEAHSVASPLLFVGLAAASAMLAFFSSAVLVPAAVYAWGPATATMLLWLGWMLGGVLAYGIAAIAGRPALRWLAPPRALDPIERRLRENASFASILLLQLALPSEIPGYLLGLARVPLARYLPALAVAELPYAAGTVLLGTGLVERRLGLLAALGGVAIVAMWVAGRTLRRRLGWL